MSILPQQITNITGVTTQNQPSLTWYIDKTTNQIQGTIDGIDAVKQAVDIILNVERFQWQIYQPYSGMQWEGLIGQDPGYVASELLRRITEALTVDDRVQGVSEYEYSISGSTMTVSFTVNTVYGSIPTTAEVALN